MNSVTVVPNPITATFLLCQIKYFQIEMIAMLLLPFEDEQFPFSCIYHTSTKIAIAACMVP